MNIRVGRTASFEKGRIEVVFHGNQQTWGEREGGVLSCTIISLQYQDRSLQVTYIVLYYVFHHFSGLVCQMLVIQLRASEETLKWEIFTCHVYVVPCFFCRVDVYDLNISFLDTKISGQ